MLATLLVAFLFIYTAMSSTSTPPAQPLKTYQSISTDPVALSPAVEAAPARASSSTGRVAQRMKELSPPSVGRRSLFDAAMQLASRGSSAVEPDIKTASVAKTTGNAWTNARSLVDFSAATAAGSHQDNSFSADSAEQAVSSVLFWNQDESYESPNKTPRKALSFSSSPLMPSGSARMTGAALFPRMSAAARTPFSNACLYVSHL